MNKIPPYKAKTLHMGDWVFGFYVERPITPFFPQDICYYIVFNDDNGYHEYKVDPNTLCEFTGLVTYNNTPLYENDLVRNYTGNIYCVQKECNTPGGCWFNTGYILQEVDTDDYITFEDTIPDIEYNNEIQLDVISE